MNDTIPQNAAERLPWHKPEVRRLTVSLDTHASPAVEPKLGSYEDAVSRQAYPDTGA
jgi:hypothetical protein